MAQALLIEDAETQIEEQDQVRVQSLERLISLLGDVQQLDLEREDFSRFFSLAVRVLELDQETVAREFKISRPTVSRWESGISAPHPLGRKPVFQLFGRLAKAKLRQHHA
jgi:hypothetical protein